ncbi:DUF554 domain-containing protein [Tuberibacillus sp. Marseille-P3662]|uniref:DUF554 domain-containing protein n=1 Tax=Tuberibacillus sp. Marseille-P3662 TaxID=1965358 RepID=UPI000A1CF0A8|nr:DUF554 domain-containing protein [Tuberibacillus sp. Marseille-P3662]
MVLTGTLVNALAIMLGAVIGTCFSKIPDNIKTTVNHAMALAVIVLGLQMGLKSDNFLIVIGSLALGGAIGECIDLEAGLNRLGTWLEQKVGAKRENGGNHNIAQGFVTATLVFVVGALAIVGALDGGLRGDHDVLLTKAMLDGFFSIIFATTLGIGVIFSAVPVFIYEGAIALFATQIHQWVPQVLLDNFITEMTATGGIMIFAIGLNLMNLTNIKTANLLPSIVICACIVAVQFIW